MKILVISDSHGRSDRFREVIKMHADADEILFLGDGVRDAFCACERAICVRGNCDALSLFGADAPSERLLCLGEFKILMMHGHEKYVKSGLDRALSYAYARGADILLFGHTHLPLERYYPAGSEVGDGNISRPIYAFNPGSLYEPRGSFGLIEIRNGSVLFSHGTV